MADPVTEYQNEDDLEEKLQHVFDGEYFRLLRAPR